ncbi:MAG: hypothetical protein ABIE74_10920 [Pseudomonadota bacterium]
MTRVFKSTELHIETKNQPGMLAQITSPLAEAGVNLHACCAYGIKKEGHFMILTDNNAKALEALEKAGFKASISDVVVVETENEVGSLNRAAADLANANVNVDYCYATTGNEGVTWIVIATKEIEKALNAIA